MLDNTPQKSPRSNLVTMITALAFAFAGAMPATATTFFNGSFESPGVGGTTYLNNNDSPIPGWIHTGVGSFQYGDFYTDGLAWGITPEDGAHYVGWGASGATGGTLSQTFDTEIGVTYAVNYWLTTQEPLKSPIPVQNVFVEVRDATDAQLTAQTNSFSQPPEWIQGLTLTFVATSTSTTLRFIDQSVGGTSLSEGTFGINWGLDDVTVLQVTPEPSTCAILGLGLGILAVFRKRKTAR